MCVGIKANKKLIGNLIVLLAQRCRPLYHTKLLKLLYLIDEESVKKTGTPITWLTYNVWQLGPVSEDVYFSKSTGYNKFDKYVSFDHVGDNSFKITPLINFNDAEFSEFDLEIIEETLSRYGKMTTQELIEITHKKGGLWDKAKERTGIKFSENNKTSDVELNFVDLLDDNFKKTIYYSTLENIELQSTLL